MRTQGTNKGRIGVNLATGTSVVVLIEIGSAGQVTWSMAADETLMVRLTIHRTSMMPKLSQ